jgi:DNA-binding XRE family transcriptional regulator
MARELLKKKRLELGLTHAEVAERAGIERVSYTHIELGINDPSFKVALEIKKILGVTDDGIFANEAV